MDEYLSEKEQIEQMRAWWRENGWYLIGGALVAGLGYFGYGQYRAYQSEQAAEASALFVEMQQMVADDRSGTEAVLGQLVADYPGSPYTDQARLLLAREVLVSNPERAVTELRTVMNESDDPQLSMIARARLARVLEYRGAYDDALAVLAVDSPGEFTAQFKAIEGDVHVARGALDEARSAYTAALTMRGAEGLDRNLLQMKLSDIAPAPAGGLQTSGVETPGDTGATE